MSKECNICCEQFNKSNHKRVICNYCDYDVCNTCTQKYLLDCLSDPQCMNCKNAWNREIMENNFTKKFYTTDYKKHREKVIFERQLSLLPETQPYVEIKKIEYEYSKKIRNISVELTKITRERNKLRLINPYQLTPNEHIEYIEKITEFDKSIKCYELDINKLRRISNIQIGRDTVKAERREFVRKCPANDCKGFLSTQWICGLCKVKVCNKCHEIKREGSSSEGGTDNEHVCNPENVASAELLMKECRQCPNKSCGAMIFKIEGCFAENTEIPQWDGSSKNSQDIQIGDKLIGDDGNMRTVLGVCSGEDEMYEITQSNGISYIVNSKHKLALKYKSEIYEIRVDTYLNMPNKSDYKGFKSDSSIESDICIKSIGHGKYYGWEIDGNHRFVLSDKTICMNCSQIWCTQCHTAFDWRTGKIETGVIHNPHFYEYQRRMNGGVAPRVAGDVICGGLPHYYTFIQHLNTVLAIKKFSKGDISDTEKNARDMVQKIETIHRMHGHINNMELPRYATNNTIETHRDLRISYMLNHISENIFKNELYKREKDHDKRNEIRMVLETYQNIIMEYIISLQTKTKPEEIFEIYDNMNTLRLYINECFEKISKRYNNVAPFITDEWHYSTTGIEKRIKKEKELADKLNKEQENA